MVKDYVTELAGTVSRVSVLMSVYNGERYLRDAVDSILGQTFTDYEFIIIDDGSTDSTWEILGGYGDGRIRLVRNDENVGLIRSLNRGLELAKGEYVARMDADDVSLSQRLAEQVSYLDSHPEIGLVGTNCHTIDSAGAITGGPFPRGFLSTVQVHWALYWGNPIVHPSVMFRAAIIRSCGGYPQGYRYAAEDYALWLRMIRDTEMAVLGQPLLHLRKHGRNITAVNRHAHIEEGIGVAQSALQHRLGYRPSDRCVRLIRHLPVEGEVAPPDVEQSIALLLDAFHTLVGRHGSETAQWRALKRNLAWRLLHLVDSYGELNRRQALIAFGHALRVSPALALSWIGEKTLSKVPLRGRVVCAARGIRARLSLD